MSGYREAPPLTDSGRRCDCVLGYEFCLLSCARARDVVRDVAFVLRLQGHIHHNTARRLALALKREGLLNDCA